MVSLFLGETGNREAGNGHVTICRVAENKCNEVTAGLAPKWSADALRIHYLRSTSRSGWFDLWSSSRDGARAQKIVTLGPFRGDEVHFDVSREGWIVWAPSHEGETLAWRSAIAGASGRRGGARLRSHAAM
jgi:hypothetical protein